MALSISPPVTETVGPRLGQTTTKACAWCRRGARGWGSGAGEEPSTQPLAYSTQHPAPSPTFRLAPCSLLLSPRALLFAQAGIGGILSMPPGRERTWLETRYALWSR